MDSDMDGLRTFPGFFEMTRCRDPEQPPPGLPRVDGFPPAILPQSADGVSAGGAARAVVPPWSVTRWAHGAGLGCAHGGASHLKGGIYTLD